MQLCEPALKLDLSSLGARVSKLESRLASGDFAPARAAAKAEPQPESEDDDRPPFPDDADDPLAGLAPPPSQPQSPADSAPQTGAQAELDRRWPELAASMREDLGVRERGFFAPGGPVRAVLKGDTLILTAQTQFVLDIIKNPRVQQLAAQKASAFFGRPMRRSSRLPDRRTPRGRTRWTRLLRAEKNTAIL